MCTWISRRKCKLTICLSPQTKHTFGRRVRLYSFYIARIGGSENNLSSNIGAGKHGDASSSFIQLSIIIRPDIKYDQAIDNPGDSMIL